MVEPLEKKIRMPRKRDWGVLCKPVKNQLPLDLGDTYVQEYSKLDILNDLLLDIPYTKLDNHHHDSYRY